MSDHYLLLPIVPGEEDQVSAYLHVLASQSFFWKGATLPLHALPRLLDEGSRPRRERAWRAAMERCMIDAPLIQGIWRKLVDRRELSSREYTQDECASLHTAVEEWVMPVLLRLHEERRLGLGVRRLRPWDLSIDPQGLPPLRPFSTSAELNAGVRRLLAALDPDWGEEFTELVEMGTLELDISGVAADVPRLLYHAGWLLMQQGSEALCPRPGPPAGGGPDDPVQPAQRPAPTGSVSMAGGLKTSVLGATLVQLLAMSHGGDLGGFYRGPDMARARHQYLEGVLLHWARTAMIDAFEQWAYARPSVVDAGACSSQWLDLWLRFLPTVDWTDLEEVVAADWQSCHALFAAPGTAITDLIGGMAAVHLWATLPERVTVDQVKRLRTAGGTQPPAELLAVAGTSFNADEHAVREAVDHIERAMVRSDAS